MHTPTTRRQTASTIYRPSAKGLRSALLCLGVAGPALLANAAAQPDETEPPDSAPPTVRPEGGVIEPTVIAPTVAPIAVGARAGEPQIPTGLPTGPLLREGTFLVRRSGALVQASTGEWIVAFQTGSSAAGIPPMVLLPCAETERIEREIEGLDRPVAIEVTGEVYAYASRNYLLPTMSRLAFVDELPQDRAAAGPSEDPDAEAGEDEPFADPVPERPADDPRVMELLDELEQGHAATPRRRVRQDAADREAPQQELAATNPSLGDGRLIVRKRGRLVRLGSGQWAFASDTGVDGIEPGPIPLLPGMTLGAIEATAGWSGEALSIEISGRLFQYRGRNLLLPTAFVLTRPSELNPLR